MTGMQTKRDNPDDGPVGVAGGIVEGDFESRSRGLHSGFNFGLGVQLVRIEHSPRLSVVPNCRVGGGVLCLFVFYSPFLSCGPEGIEG